MSSRAEKPGQAGGVANRFRSIQQFGRWCAEEGEIAESFAAGLRPAKIPETTPPVLTDDDLRALFRITEGTDFAARRDRALMSLLVDTGMRVSGCAARHARW